MKDTITDANFPRTSDQRVYHLGVRAGEVANRIITVGSPSRARVLASLLDSLPRPFELYSERGFLTITGRYHGIPVSIISIGMGYPNMDFFVREVRECLLGDMAVIRLGSCGALADIPVGSVVIPKASISVTRNVDFDFAHGESKEAPYRISRPAYADAELHDALVQTMSASPDQSVLGETINASADSFYSSQGRQTSFMDHNSDLIKRLQAATPGLATLEMETFHLFHLASCWNARSPPPRKSHPSPLTTNPVLPDIRQPSSASLPVIPSPLIDTASLNTQSAIKAAAVHLVFASRTSQEFITPQRVVDLEAWAGQHVLTALCEFYIDEDKLHPEAQSVWRNANPQI